MGEEFLEQLKIGQDQELVILDWFRKTGVKCDKYNKTNVKEVDLILPDNNILIDVKYRTSPFRLARKFTGYSPSECLTITKRHVNVYREKEVADGIPVWLCYFVDYKGLDYGLYFISNNMLYSMIKAKPSMEPNFHFSSALSCLTALDFIKEIL